ncbi:hypothetical protein ABZ471_08355 [Streptomyces sp. NPDC005728]|uniref:hypothetical protein n=1 Tax=Streptomyces sp. NPDC005728 TaxID=3157054 RepID=UPI0033EA322C
MEQFLAALVNGVPFAGRRPNTNTNPDNPNIVSGPANTAGWIDLSTITGFPTNSPVCDVSVDAQGSDAFYKIITQGGSVYTLHCAANGTKWCGDVFDVVGTPCHHHSQRGHTHPVEVPPAAGRGAGRPGRVASPEVFDLLRDI